MKVTRAATFVRSGSAPPVANSGWPEEGDVKWLRPSIGEFDVLVEDDDALLVAHDIVAVQAVRRIRRIYSPSAPWCP